MREIKFRSWDNHLKFMVDIKSYSISLDGQIFFNNNGDIHNQTNKLILMQFTGLKDKNGKEIYEGDIVKDEVGTVIKVILQPGSFGFDYMNGRVDVCGIGKFCEIIGNIYENPELMEKSNE